MLESQHQQVHLIPVDAITVANPRVRNRKAFEEIVDNIAKIGLKRPITVTRKETPEGSRYELICGQGRLEAFRALNQTEIPAFVITADVESGMVMSLIENVARRQHSATDLLQDIGGLRRRGYEPVEIAKKTGLSPDYVRSVLRLLEGGELRLLRAVESGQIPITVAAEIAESDDSSAQQVLQQAYENKVLRGRKLIAAKRLIEQRRRRGKTGVPTERKRPLSVQTLLRTYRESTDKKRLIVKKAESTRDSLVFVTEALRKILSDASFVTLLRAEGLETLPQNLSDRLSRHGEA